MRLQSVIEEYKNQKLYANFEGRFVSHVFQFTALMPSYYYKIMYEVIKIISVSQLHGLVTSEDLHVTFFSFGATAPQWARASSFSRFLDHTQRHTTVGRTPLDE